MYVCVCSVRRSCSSLMLPSAGNALRCWTARIARFAAARVHARTDPNVALVCVHHQMASLDDSLDEERLLTAQVRNHSVKIKARAPWQNGEERYSWKFSPHPPSAVTYAVLPSSRFVHAEQGINGSVTVARRSVGRLADLRACGCASSQETGTPATRRCVRLSALTTCA